MGYRGRPLFLVAPYRGNWLVRFDSPTEECCLPAPLRGTFQNVARDIVVNWVFGVACLAVATFALAIVTDLQMTKYQSGSAAQSSLNW